MKLVELAPTPHDLTQSHRELAREQETVRGWVREMLQSLLEQHPEEVGVWIRKALTEVLASERQRLPARPAEPNGVASGGLRSVLHRLGGLRTPASDWLGLKKLVRTELAALPVAARAASTAKELAIFQAPSENGPLPPIAAHVAQGTYGVRVPIELLEEPLEAYLARDPLPLPTTEDREGYHAGHEFDYWLSGLDDWLKLRAILRRHAVELRPGAAALDFGCASGRVLRHELCQADGLDVWGVDLNERHLAWLYANMPRRLKAFQCTTLPALPLPDAHFDLVTAYSVFTHIDEFEIAWLAELRRVLKPGGIAYLTIHSDHTWSRVRPGQTVYEHLWLARDMIPEYEISPQLFQRAMPGEKTVFRWRSASLNNTNVFLSARHVHEVWGRFFDVLEIVSEGASYQDVVVLRKPG